MSSIPAGGGSFTGAAAIALRPRPSPRCACSADDDGRRPWLVLRARSWPCSTGVSNGARPSRSPTPSASTGITSRAAARDCRSRTCPRLPEPATHELLKTGAVRGRLREGRQRHPPGRGAPAARDDRVLSRPRELLRHDLRHARVRGRPGAGASRAITSPSTSPSCPGRPIAVTPAFMGANPASVPSGPAPGAPHPQGRAGPRPAPWPRAWRRPFGRGS